MIRVSLNPLSSVTNLTISGSSCQRANQLARARLQGDVIGQRCRLQGEWPRGRGSGKAMAGRRQLRRQCHPLSRHHRDPRMIAV